MFRLGPPTPLMNIANSGVLAKSVADPQNKGPQSLRSPSFFTTLP